MWRGRPFGSAQGGPRRVCSGVDDKFDPVHILPSIAVQRSQVAWRESLQFPLPSSIGYFHPQHAIHKAHGSRAFGHGRSANQRPREQRSFALRRAPQRTGDKFLESQTGVLHLVKSLLCCHVFDQPGESDFSICRALLNGAFTAGTRAGQTSAPHRVKAGVLPAAHLPRHGESRETADQANIPPRSDRRP